MSGGILPAAVGVLGTAILVSGASEAGSVTILTAWSVMGYMTLTDLGLTRSASKMVSSGRTDPPTAIAELWRSAIPLGGGLGLLVILLAVTVSPWLWILVPIPFVAALQFPLMGALEAQGRFDVVATQRLLNSIVVYLLPAVCIVFIPGVSGVAIGLAILSLGRLALFFVLVRHLSLPLFATSRATYARGDRSSHGRGLVFWVGVSSVIGPAFLYADRLVLALFGVPTEVWVLYVALSEILMKTYVLPSAVLSVAFPWLAARARDHLPALRRAVGYLFPSVTVLLAAIVTGVGLLLPSSIFTAIAPGIDQAETRWLVILLTSGAVVNWVSQGYIALLQALDRQRFVAISQMSLVPAFIAGMLIAGVMGSAVGIAGVSLARITVFSLILAISAWFATSSARGMRQP